MNRRKYLASLGLIGVGGYTMYNNQPVLASEINLDDSIELPSEVEETEEFTLQLTLTDFKITPRRIGSDVALHGVKIRGKTNSTEFGSDKEIDIKNDIKLDNGNSISVLNKDSETIEIDVKFDENSFELIIEFELNTSLDKFTIQEILAIQIKQIEPRNIMAYGYGRSGYNVYIRNTQNWDLKEKFTLPNLATNDISFSPNGQFIAYASNDDNLYIHETKKWDNVKIINSDDNVQSVDFSPDGNYIAYSFEDKMHLRNVPDWNIHKELDFESIPSSIKFFPNNKFIAYRENGKLKIRETNNLESEKLISKSDNVSDFDISPDGNYIASINNEDINIYDANNFEFIRNINKDGRTITFSRDSKYIAHGDWDGIVYVHNTDDWGSETRLEKANNSIRTIDFSPDGNLMAYGENSPNGKVYVHNISNWSLIDEFYSDEGERVNVVKFYPEFK